MEVRIKKIKGKCRLQLEPIPIPNTNQRVIQYAHHAEQLVFKKLAYCRLKEIECWGCGRSHIEFFWVSEARALEVIEEIRLRMEEEHGVAEQKKPSDKGQDKVHSETRSCSHAARIKRNSPNPKSQKHPTCTVETGAKPSSESSEPQNGCSLSPSGHTSQKNDSPTGAEAPTPPSPSLPCKANSYNDFRASFSRRPRRPRSIQV
jgi:hypothetical protein